MSAHPDSDSPEMSSLGVSYDELNASGSQNAAHTPGPWILRPSNDPAGTYSIATTGEPLIIGFVCHDIPAGEANARLIAAAPELLEACEAMLSESLAYDLPTIRQARAAIAKAKGGK